MNAQSTKIYRLEDYQSTPYIILRTDLLFKLEPTKTLVKSTLLFENRHDDDLNKPLILDGDELQLVAISINDIPLETNAYDVSSSMLHIFNPPQGQFTLCITTEINPEKNRQLMGLYRSNGVYCTQCEAEGFRRITYFYDRPDVLSIYRVRIEADQLENPVLLSNGNMVESGALENGRHFTVWEDPHPKPSYLFALVGGDLDHLQDQFVTASKRQVKLGIYVEKGKTKSAIYAMDALKRSMLWDEQRFGREYDLDIFNIVAVSDFNMGAMENKGLNIFNDKYVLADTDTATDTDYAGIERVIAHEYFHNWTGNRITCRDWFQLCLKEGLTVFRDQEFTSDQASRAVQRIDQVRLLKAAQFPEDAGPLAHAVRPRHYSEINNFYTATIYEKGAEIVRMIHTMVGEKTFRTAMDLYFDRHDGQACVIEDFIQCFADITGKDYSQFMLWYEQAGTPQVKIDTEFHDDILKITAHQSLAPTAGQPQKQPMLIPISFGVMDENGQELAYQTSDNIENGILILSKKTQTFQLTGFKEKPLLSLLRGFSAPITLKYSLDTQALQFLAKFDNDAVNRWQSINQLFMQTLSQAVYDTALQDVAISSEFMELLGAILIDDRLEPAFRALCLQVPSETEIARIISQNIEPERIFAIRTQLMQKIAGEHQQKFMTIYKQMIAKSPYTPDASQAGIRALKNLALDYLCIAQKTVTLANQHYLQADNMTDRMAGLAALIYRFHNSAEAINALKHFENHYYNNPLVMDKWFSVQALIQGDEALKRVQRLMTHPLFSLDNPNRTRALIAMFASHNQTGFNRVDGAGYEFFADIILKIDPQNSQLSSRLLTILRSWRQFEPVRREKLEIALKRIANTKNLSTDVTDIVERILG